MTSIDLAWETWRGDDGALREKGLPYKLEHADYLEWQLEQHGPGEATVCLSLTDDVFLCLYNWARWQQDLQLPAERE